MALAAEIAALGAMPAFRGEPAEVVVDLGSPPATTRASPSIASTASCWLARSRTATTCPSSVAADIEAERAAESFTLSSCKIGVQALLRGKPPVFEQPLE